MNEYLSVFKNSMNKLIEELELKDRIFITYEIKTYTRNGKCTACIPHMPVFGEDDSKKEYYFIEELNNEW